MRVVLQRVKEASVTIDGNVHGQIQQGYMALVGICEEDNQEIVAKLAKKTASTPPWIPQVTYRMNGLSKSFRIPICFFMT